MRLLWPFAPAYSLALARLVASSWRLTPRVPRVTLHDNRVYDGRGGWGSQAGGRARGYAVVVGSKRRRRCALAAASQRLPTPSLPRTLDTWTLAVLGEMNSTPAISRLLRPAATRRSTSSSRSVSPSPSSPAPAPDPAPSAPETTEA